MSTRWCGCRRPRTTSASYAVAYATGTVAACARVQLSGTSQSACGLEATMVAMEFWGVMPIILLPLTLSCTAACTNPQMRQSSFEPDLMSSSQQQSATEPIGIVQGFTLPENSRPIWLPPWPWLIKSLLSLP